MPASLPTNSPSAIQLNGFAPSPEIPQQGPGGPSALPRNFRAPGFDYSCPIGTLPVVTTGPIGRPQKTNSNFRHLLRCWLLVPEGDSPSPALVQLAPRDPFNLSLVPLNRQGQGLLLLFAGCLARRFLAHPLLRLTTTKQCQLRVERWLMVAFGVFLLLLTSENHGTFAAWISNSTFEPPSASRWIISLGNGKSERSVTSLKPFPP